MRLFDRYIRHSIISATLMVCFIAFSLLFFISLVGEASPRLSMGRIFLLALMSMPEQFYALFPIAVFLGVLIALSRLSLSSQLIIFRAAGISIARIALSTLKTVLLLVFFVTLFAETYMPRVQYYYAQAEQQAGEALHFSAFPAPRSIWVRQGAIFTHVQRVSGDAQLDGITHYVFNQDNKLQRALYAERAHLKGKRWELHDLVESVFHQGHVAAIKEKSTKEALSLHKKMDAYMQVSPNQQSLLRLFKTIEYRRAFGLSTSRSAFIFWKRILQPFATLVLALLALPFVFGSFRDTSASYRIMLGVMLGVVFYSVNQLFGPITIIYDFPPFVAALMPTLVFALLAVFLVRRA